MDSQTLQSTNAAAYLPIKEWAERSKIAFCEDQEEGNFRLILQDCTDEQLDELDKLALQHNFRWRTSNLAVHMEGKGDDTRKAAA